MTDQHEMEWNRVKQEFGQQKMSGEQVAALKARIECAKRDRRRIRIQRRVKSLSAVAACVAVFILIPNTSAQAAGLMSGIPLLGKLVDVVTFRDYHYDDGTSSADAAIPELAAEEGTIYKNSVQTINEEIAELTGRYLAEFENLAKKKDGGQAVLAIDSEVICTTEDYFTLKLNVFTSEASGMEWKYFYTIDLKTGERILLKDLFKDGTDYRTAISEDIQNQMKAQMAQNEDVVYWTADAEAENFGETEVNLITEETSFYLDEAGRLVIVFNEGDVAPYSAGVVAFTVTPAAISNIRK